jgi:hypothetical protein
MTKARVRTEIWVSAGLRQWNTRGQGAYVLRRGDVERGMVLLKLARWREGCTVQSLSRDLDGNLTWLPALKGELVSEADAEAYVAREVKRDPDLWVIEVETTDGSHPFDLSTL